MEAFDHDFFEAIQKLENEIKIVLERLELEEQKYLQEIRIRRSSPLVIKIKGENYYVSRSGKITNKFSHDLFIVKQEQIEKSLERMCEYSIFAYQEQIRNGFITLEGGHRVGLSGRAILENGSITNISDINSLNIRISRMITGVADELIDLVFRNGLKSILICGRPGSGKTTIIKDLIRQISLGKIGDIYNISVVDEREEMIGKIDRVLGSKGCYADVFSGYPKGEGMMMALRTMGPDLIVCDEIGGESEVMAIENALNSGVKIIASVHATTEDELLRKTQIKRLIELKVFEVAIFLDSGKIPCKIKKIINLD